MDHCKSDAGHLIGPTRNGCIHNRTCLFYVVIRDLEQMRYFVAKEALFAILVIVLDIDAIICRLYVLGRNG
ncbi:hypothetical protein D3C71_1756600 [compost metagenome]